MLELFSGWNISIHVCEQGDAGRRNPNLTFPSSLLFELNQINTFDLTFNGCITTFNKIASPWLMRQIYLTTNVMFRHSRTSRLSPHPPFPFRSFCFLITLATVSIRFFGYIWPALVATLITCWTFEITWLDSQLFFLWWTPLKLEINL